MKSVDKEKNLRFTVHSVDIMEILSHTFLAKRFVSVRATVLLKKKREGWISKYIFFFGEREFLLFPRCSFIAKQSGNTIKFVKMMLYCYRQK